MSEARRLLKRLRQRHRPRQQPKDEVMMKGGSKMAILRPLDPALALRMVDEIPNGLAHEEADKRFNAILDAQPYRFIGMAKKPAPGDQGAGIILEPATLKRIGTMQPGDSFVDYDVMQRHGVRVPDPTTPPAPDAEIHRVH